LKKERITGNNSQAGREVRVTPEQNSEAAKITAGFFEGVTISSPYQSVWASSYSVPHGSATNRAKSSNAVHKSARQAGERADKDTASKRRNY
jgi:hypothetical protein